MKLKAITSTPLRPIATRARDLSKDCDELLVATAFVSENAVADVVGTALAGRAVVRFLTGTFGRVTRRKTFIHLHRLAQKSEIEPRVWKGDFHAKLLLWRTGSQGVAWIGSANLTDRGLQAAGELLAEVRGPWAGVALSQLRKAFEAEWRRGVVLDHAFLKSYRESPRMRGLLDVPPKGAPQPPSKKTAMDRRAMLVVPVSRYYAEDGETVARIDARLGGTAAAWYRGKATALRIVQPGDALLLVDTINRQLQLRTATDVVRDGSAWVVAHDTWGRGATRPLNSRIRRQLSKLGLSATKQAFRTNWVDREGATAIVTTVFGATLAKRFTGALPAKPRK